ncbi:MAG: (2Fe-2S) ferredoxin domain-containing protein [Acidobacteriota bacterium]
MLTASEPVLQTKRTIIGHVVMCSGCCCGKVERGKPAVPIEWLKQEWRSRGLLKNIQLSISGCLGPCDLPNVVSVSSPTGSIWLGNVNRFEQYEALVNWASASKAAGTLLPLPQEFEMLRFDPFLRKNQLATATMIGGGIF